MTHKKPTTVSSSSVLDLLDFCDAWDIKYSESSLIIRKHLLDPELRIDETLVISLWNEIIENTDKPHVGLLIGQQINPAAKGLLASWISQCETLREALIIFQKHISLMNPTEQWQMNIEGEITQLTFTLDAEKHYPIAAIERSMSALLSWGRALSGEELQPKRVTFECPEPECLEQYEKVFGENIHFNHSENAISFDSTLFELPIKSANPFLKKMIQVKAQENLNVLNTRLLLSQQLAVLIEKNLASQKVTVEYFSTLLNMSRQTLYRKLKLEGSDYKTILNNVRKEQVIELLSSDKVNMLYVSLQLGFKETSSFYKAFHRWFDMTPTEYLDLRNKSN